MPRVKQPIHDRDPGRLAPKSRGEWRWGNTGVVPVTSQKKGAQQTWTNTDTYLGRSHTFTGSTPKTTEEETEAQGSSSDLPSFTQLRSQGQNLTPSPHIFQEHVHLENLSPWWRRMEQAIKTDENLLGYSTFSALIPYLLSNRLILILLLKWVYLQGR